MTRHNLYSLWLIPDEHAQACFSEIITKLVSLYHGPVFKPHITLLGSIACTQADAINNAARIASELEPFAVQFSNIEGLDEYYRCLFMKAIPDRTLLHANALAKQLFKRDSCNEFMPHLSLIYGNISDEEKEKMKDIIDPYLKAQLQVTAIELYETQGTPEDWQCLQSFPLST